MYYWLSITRYREHVVHGVAMFTLLNQRHGSVDKQPREVQAYCLLKMVRCAKREHGLRSHAWTPQRYSAPMWRAPPEGELASR